MNKSTRALSEGAVQKLQSHHWPGNVRELRNVIERALILETAPQIQPDSLPDFRIEGRLMKEPAAKPAAGSGSLDEIMANFERELITSILEQNHYNLTKAADQLKISRHALRYRMQRLNISAGADAEPEPPVAAEKDKP
jgi:DNA-binding NtrC family response regulator